MVPTLVHIPYSPWSRRARQALALEGIEHRRETYLPGVSEPSLRLRTGRWTGRVSVPVLLVPGQEALMDSTAIAAWASEHGEAHLLPAESRAAIDAVVALAQRVLDAGRVRTTQRTLADPEALRESLPPALRALGPLGLAAGRPVAANLIPKWGSEVPEDVEGELADAVSALAERVGEGGWLLGDRVTFADLAAASALVFIAPPADLPLGPRTRVAFSHAGLAEEHAALVAWRDRVDAVAAEARGGR